MKPEQRIGHTQRFSAGRRWRQGAAFLPMGVGVSLVVLHAAQVLSTLLHVDFSGGPVLLAAASCGAIGGLLLLATTPPPQVRISAGWIAVLPPWLPVWVLAPRSRYILSELEGQSWVISQRSKKQLIPCPSTRADPLDLELAPGSATTVRPSKAVGGYREARPGLAERRGQIDRSRSIALSALTGYLALALLLLFEPSRQLGAVGISAALALTVGLYAWRRRGTTVEVSCKNGTLEVKYGDGRIAFQHRLADPLDVWCRVPTHGCCGVLILEGDRRIEVSRVQEVVEFVELLERERASSSLTTDSTSGDRE